MSLIVRRYDSFQDLPPAYATLRVVADDQGFFSQPEWFEYLMKYNYEDHNVLRLCAVEEAANGKPYLLMPLRYTRMDGAVPSAHTLASICHTENYASACILAAEDSPYSLEELLRTLFTWANSDWPDSDPGKVDVIRLWPFESGSTLGNRVLESLSEAGFLVQTYANSHNWYERVSGISHEDYFSKRSSSQRYLVRRKKRNIEKSGEVEFSMYRDDARPDELERAIDEYIVVSAHSWKEVSSTVSRPIVELIRLAAFKKCLRLGILRLDGKAIAAQFWVLSGGVASVIRANYHEDYGKLSPGVVLSDLILEHLLDRDEVELLDFGYGNDEYKHKWMNTPREYHGIMAFNPHSPRGVYFGAKHIVGRSVKNRLRQAGLISTPVEGSSEKGEA